VQVTSPIVFCLVLEASYTLDIPASRKITFPVIPVGTGVTIVPWRDRQAGILSSTGLRPFNELEYLDHMGMKTSVDST
jgi:hypothetical protein